MILIWRYIVWIAFAMIALSANAVVYRVKLDAPSLIDSLLTTHLDIMRWQGDDIDEQQLQRLYQRSEEDAKQLLATRGYFNSKINVVLLSKQNVFEIHMHVIPGSLTTVSQVSLHLSGAVLHEPDSQAWQQHLNANWPLPVGSLFTQSAWQDAKRQGLQYLLADRFPAARIVSSQAFIDPQRNQARLQVTYDSGPRFTLGKLLIQGLRRYPPTLIERLRNFSPGDVYKQSVLLNFQESIQATPYFSQVMIDVPIVSESPNEVPVTVTVTEAPFSKVSVGLGYSTDSGIRSLLTHQHNHVFKRGWIANTTVKWDRLQQNWNFGLQMPAIYRDYRYGGAIDFKRTDIEGLEIEQTKLTLKRGRSRGLIGVTQSMNYTIERKKSNAITNKNRTLQLSEGWIRHDLDDPLAPRYGTIFEWQLGGAARGLLSDSSFLRAYGRSVWFLPFSNTHLLLLRAEAGQVFSYDAPEIPSDQLFRTGGNDSVRGYAYQSLGIREGKAIIGGRVLATGSLEYQYRFSESWSLAAFIDAGNAANRWQDFRVVRGYGPGLRWYSPVGPVALDIAYGEQRQRWRLHFSVGAAF